MEVQILCTRLMEQMSQSWASMIFFQRYGKYTLPYMPLIVALDDLMRAWIYMWIPIEGIKGFNR